jgi:hypothetical protein
MQGIREYAMAHFEIKGTKMSEPKLKKVTRSSDLSQYKLNAHLKGVLASIDKLREYNLSSGRANAPAIRLWGHDFNMIDNIVRQ